MGGVLRAPASSPVWECDFNEAVRQLHLNHTSRIFGAPVHESTSEGLLRNMLTCKYLLLFYENK